MKTNAVYIIDDEPALLELLSDITELAGLKAHTFLNARDFFANVTQFAPNSILVLDLHMPGMDGIEVMRRLAKMANVPGLVLISGHDPGVLHAAEKLGKAHNLNILASFGKPIPIDEFQNLLIQNLPGKDRQPTWENANFPDREELLRALEAAISDGQLFLEFQPQFEIKSSRLLGAEALVRWRHPSKGLIQPSVFIPLAEKSGLIKGITHYVIDTAVALEQQWQEEGLSLNLSVNVSGVDITSLTLPEQLSELLSKNKIDPTRLTLEITESSLMGELVTSLDILTRLRLKGIGLSIDDFGTGYSSFSLLHRIPFTELKIDRSFVNHIESDEEARAIVKTCVILGHELNLQVVAEGIENPEHLSYLESIGCDIAQGFYLGKPMSVEEITELLRKEQAAS